jgi:hypothetical protein
MQPYTLPPPFSQSGKASLANHFVGADGTSHGHPGGWGCPAAAGKQEAFGDLDAPHEPISAG